MDTIAQYRRLANECIEMSRRAKQQHRRKLEQIAELWLALAADELNEASEKSKHARARSTYLEDLQRD